MSYSEFQDMVEKVAREYGNFPTYSKEQINSFKNRRVRVIFDYNERVESVYNHYGLDIVHGDTDSIVIKPQFKMTQGELDNRIKLAKRDVSKLK